MSASIITYVDVTVNLAEGSADRFSFGNLMGVFSHSVSAARQSGPYTTLAEVVAAGFTSVAAPEIYNWSSAVFSQANGVDQLLIGKKLDSDASYSAALDNILASGSNDWYITNIQSRVDADISSAASWTESADAKIFIAQSTGSNVLTNGASIAATLETAGYNRTALMYHVTGSGAVEGYADGAWSSVGGGMNLDVPGGVGIWGYKTLTGITYDSLTAGDATNVLANNANFYGRSKGLSFTTKGQMASGRFIDVQTTIDWLQLRIEEAILSLFVSVSNSGKKIPFTNAGINQVVGAVQSVLDKGVSFGHLSEDTPPTITVPNVNTISAADKEARVLTLSAEAVLAGAIQKLVLTVNVTY